MPPLQVNWKIKISTAVCLLFVLILCIGWTNWVPTVNAKPLKPTNNFKIKCFSDHQCPLGTYCHVRSVRGEKFCLPCVECHLYSKEPNPSGCAHFSWECGPCLEGFKQLDDEDKKCLYQGLGQEFSHRANHSKRTFAGVDHDSPNEIDNQIQEPSSFDSSIGPTPIVVIIVCCLLVFCGFGVWISYCPKKSSGLKRRRPSEENNDDTGSPILPGVGSERNSHDVNGHEHLHGLIVPSAPPSDEYDQQNAYNNNYNLSHLRSNNGNNTPIPIQTPCERQPTKNRNVQACPWNVGNGAGSWATAHDEVDMREAETGQGQDHPPSPDLPEEANQEQVVPEPVHAPVPETQESVSIRGQQQEVDEADVVMEEMEMEVLEPIDIDDALGLAGSGEADNEIPENPLAGQVQVYENPVDIRPDGLVARTVSVLIILRQHLEPAVPVQSSFDPEATVLNLSEIADESGSEPGEDDRNNYGSFHPISAPFVPDSSDVSMDSIYNDIEVEDERSNNANQPELEEVLVYDVIIQQEV